MSKIYDQLMADVASQSNGQPFTLQFQHGGVTVTVNVYLDNDQLPHQDKADPIGTRKVGGKTQWPAGCNYAWHLQHTMPAIAAQAETLYKAGGLKIGAFTSTKQKQVFDTVERKPQSFSFEGVYLLEGQTITVSCHCYPAR